MTLEQALEVSANDDTSRREDALVVLTRVVEESPKKLSCSLSKVRSVRTVLLNSLRINVRLQHTRSEIQEALGVHAPVGAFSG